MMTKIRIPLYKNLFLSSFLLIFFFILPFGVLADLIDEDADNDSVLDIFERLEGQGPDKQNPLEPENNGLAESLGEQENVIENDLDGLMKEQSLFGMFVQLFLALAVIIMMIYALIRFIGKRSQSYQANQTLQNIGGVHIGTNRSIQLVRVGKRILVVGVGESIQLLKEIDNPDEVTTILNDNEIQEGQQQLSSLFNKVKTKFSDQKEGTDNSKGSFKSLLERQLTDVKKSQRDAHAAIKEDEQR
ncbi:flagellar biosynthetic protein FliO [Bacillaceae bacterium IKA-2]|nr:flagellar biosynthetic protein FliO [Bacillaceae bacterium IKA-2]